MVDANLLILKRIFEALDIQPAMGGVDDRKLKQKAVYLCQITGLDLGYRYGWYLMGPYSPGLARDYYALADATLEDNDNRPLNQQTLARLGRVQELINDEYRPAQLSKEGWFELLASWHYLTKVNGKSDQEAREVIIREKPHLLDFIDAAIQRFQTIN